MWRTSGIISGDRGGAAGAVAAGACRGAAPPMRTVTFDTPGSRFSTRVAMLCRVARTWGDWGDRKSVV